MSSNTGNPLDNKEKHKAVDLAVSQIERSFGKGAIMKLGDQIGRAAAAQAGVVQRHLGGEAAKHSLRGRGAVGEGTLVALHRRDIAQVVGKVAVAIDDQGATESRPTHSVHGIPPHRVLKRTSLTLR